MLRGSAGLILATVATGAGLVPVGRARPVDPLQTPRWE